MVSANTCGSCRVVECLLLLLIPPLLVALGFRQVPFFQ